MASKLPKSKVKRAILEGSSVPRMSGDAVPAAIDIAIDFLKSLGDRASGIASSHGRKTIMPEDVKQACHIVHGGPICDALALPQRKKRAVGKVDELEDDEDDTTVSVKEE